MAPSEYTKRILSSCKQCIISQDRLPSDDPEHHHNLASFLLKMKETQQGETLRDSRIRARHAQNIQTPSSNQAQTKLKPKQNALSL